MCSCVVFRKPTVLEMCTDIELNLLNLFSFAAPVGLNLGKKMSIPKDIMMEELNLPSNRGSRMFQERQKRAERFTLENVANGINNTSRVRNWERSSFSCHEDRSPLFPQSFSVMQ